MKTDMIEVSGNEVQPTECVVLMQMITSNDLNDPEELEDIKTDIKSECGNYGTVIDLVIPTLNQPGAGKVYLKYSNVSEAQVAKSALQGRSFGDSTVICTFYDVEKFDKKQFT
jgi:splicing factor U2AF subunit